MTVVNFVGPMLFVLDKKKLDRIYVPNAKELAPRDSNWPGLHADGSQARPHYAGILLLDKNNKPKAQREDLTGKTLGISDGTNGPTSFKLKLVPAIDEINAGNGVGLVLDPRPPYLAFEVQLTGGDMDRVESNLGWRIRDPFGKKHRFRKKQVLWYREFWTARKAPVSITIDGVQWMTLDADDNAYVYNAEKPFPSVGDLESGEYCKGLGTLYPDDDFKWLYGLTRPSNNSTLSDWANDQTDGELLAPFTRCESLLNTPFVSTCYAATWGGGETGGE